MVSPRVGIVCGDAGEGRGHKGRDGGGRRGYCASEYAHSRAGGRLVGAGIDGNPRGIVPNPAGIIYIRGGEALQLPGRVVAPSER